MPYSSEHVLNIAFQLIVQTGLFLEDCKIYTCQSAFKAFFATTHQEWRESFITTAGAGFQSANHAYQQDTVDSISNLATATESDCASIAALTATNRTLYDRLATNNSKLITALQEITKIKSFLAALQRTSSSRSTCSDPNWHYCWTHVYLCIHRSRYCPSSVTGHQKTATNRDKKGGATTSFQSTWKTQVTTHNRKIT